MLRIKKMQNMLKLLFCCINICFALFMHKDKIYFVLFTILN